MIITIAASKGGTGKTTTAVSVAARLASAREDVLLVDFDQQGHCAIALGMDPEPGVFGWLVADAGFYNCKRMTGRVGLELLPGDSKTKLVELVYRAEADPLRRVQEQIRAYVGDYDHLVIDTPPSGLLQEAAIAVADVLIVPVRLEHLGLDGVNATYALAQRLNRGAQVIVLPTQYDARLREHRYNLELLMDLNGKDGLAVAQPIPARVAVAEAVASGQTVWEFPGRRIGDVTVAYMQLVEMIGEVGNEA